jgi:hypothetical protein
MNRKLVFCEMLQFVADLLYLAIIGVTAGTLLGKVIWLCWKGDIS